MFLRLYVHSQLTCWTNLWECLSIFFCLFTIRHYMWLELCSFKLVMSYFILLLFSNESATLIFLSKVTYLLYWWESNKGNLFNLEQLATTCSTGSETVFLPRFHGMNSLYSSSAVCFIHALSSLIIISFNWQWHDINLYRWWLASCSLLIRDCSNFGVLLVSDVKFLDVGHWTIHVSIIDSYFQCEPLFERRLRCLTDSQIIRRALSLSYFRLVYFSCFVGDLVYNLTLWPSNMTTDKLLSSKSLFSMYCLIWTRVSYVFAWAVWI